MYARRRKEPASSASKCWHMKFTWALSVSCKCGAMLSTGADQGRAPAPRRSFRTSAQCLS